MEISESVRYIGADDPTLDLFEGQYQVDDGVSYNSYLIIDQKIAIVDTIDQRCSDLWVENLERELGGRHPDYLIVSHLEPDHSANIQRAMQMYPDMVAVCTAVAKKMMPQFLDTKELANRIVIVKEGDTLSLGHHNLQFIMAPMVHWPEVMMTYETSDKLLFSADAFGKFGVNANYDGKWACEARRYYFNIVGKWGQQVQALLKKVSKLDIKTILPLHGPVLTENLEYYIGLYDTWSSYRPETEGVFIAYCSMHGNTARAAQALADDIMAINPDCKLSIVDLSRSDMAENVEDAFRYSTLVLAAPTYDTDVMPVMHHFLHHLESKGYSRRRVGIIENGSWAPMAAKRMKEQLALMKDIEIINPTVTIFSSLNDKSHADLHSLALATVKEI